MNSARLKRTSYSRKYNYSESVNYLRLNFLKNTVILNFVKKKHTHTHISEDIYFSTRRRERIYKKFFYCPFGYEWFRYVRLPQLPKVSSSIDFSLGRRVIMIAEGPQWFEFLCIFFRITAGVLFWGRSSKVKFKYVK